jgi:hypothetical protein
MIDAALVRSERLPSVRIPRAVDWCHQIDRPGARSGMAR